jgi:putative copper resistance protein D
MPDMQMGGVEPLTWHVLLTTWHPAIGWDVFVAILFVAYVNGLRLARRRGTPGVPWYRVGCFLLGLAALVFSVNSAVATYSHVLFWVHMVQHLLLIMVVPALLVLGSPLTLLIQVTRGRAQQRARAVLLSKPVAFLTHPLVGLLLYSAIIVGTHLTSFMQQMMLHPWLHDVEQVLYLVGGYIFLLPLLGDEPIRWRPPYIARIGLLFVAMAPETIVGIVLLQADHELFPAYAAVHRMWGPSPLADLNRGGGIMWAWGDGLMMAFIVGVVIAYITHASSNATAGAWLEGVRRSTLAHSLESAGESTDLGAADLDSDDAALNAYNRMLAKLNEDSRPSKAGETGGSGR